MTARNIVIESMEKLPVENQQVEVVERKGLGHPDYICDAVVEHVSVELNQAYLREFGRIEHYNIDKGLLVAGEADLMVGGGHITKPMRLIIGDRATHLGGGKPELDRLVEEVTSRWFESHLRFVNPTTDVIIENVLDVGSPELTHVIRAGGPVANDTSAAVGYAPLTTTERFVLDMERYLNSAEFKAQFPASGEDIKVMGIRYGGHLSLTVAMAFVDRFIQSEKDYFATKDAIHDALRDFVKNRSTRLQQVDVDLNKLDRKGAGINGMYLTVTGTSAESADSGEVGRGNRVNGLIALNRPMGTEAAAGKNPVSHVGKIYNFLTHRIASEIHQGVPGIAEVYVWLVSQIGSPIDRPLVASAQLALLPGVSLEAIEADVRKTIDGELANVQAFTEQLAKGVYPVC
jgi:S-adenosylmethionine synthetase